MTSEGANPRGSGRMLPHDVARAWRGDEGDPVGEFEAIVREHQPKLLRYANRLLRDPDAAQDAVQETFLKLLREPPSGESAGRISNWLYRVTHNLCVDFIRKESRMRNHHEKIETVESEAPFERMFDAEDARGRVEYALTRLSDNQRAALVLRIYEGKSYREIAEITGMSVSNVGFHVYQGLKKAAAILRGREQAS